jgi:hypothetical protein
MPHELIIDLGRSLALKGITCLPRQDQANGRIAGVEVYTSSDANQWSPPRASARWANTDQLQEVRFSEPVNARYLKLVAKSEVSGNAFAALAELDVIE